MLSLSSYNKLQQILILTFTAIALAAQFLVAAGSCFAGGEF
jgi:hypothetical protein